MPCQAPQPMRAEEGATVTDGSDHPSARRAHGDTGRRAAWLQSAVRYQEILDGTEDSQRVYHRNYPSYVLRPLLRPAVPR